MSSPGLRARTSPFRFFMRVLSWLGRINAIRLKLVKTLLADGGEMTFPSLFAFRIIKTLERWHGLGNAGQHVHGSLESGTGFVEQVYRVVCEHVSSPQRNHPLLPARDRGAGSR